jgi:hypothetical protein
MVVQKVSAVVVMVSFNLRSIAGSGEGGCYEARVLVDGVMRRRGGGGGEIKMMYFSRKWKLVRIG